MSTRIYDLNVAVRVSPDGSRMLTLRAGNDEVARMTDDNETSLGEAVATLLGLMVAK